MGGVLLGEYLMFGEFYTRVFVVLLLFYRELTCLLLTFTLVVY